ncbi:hypothetical protein TIFTF001_025275 [Ficus carica]|uniref:Uncharacterized protein n=1 Tax=Ficus carica TaxID=3494 RepID=A0AA88DFF1_FICCA|nr:hypothetical protein TIFTF001_025275 [Ficus carica]
MKGQRPLVSPPVEGEESYEALLVLLELKSFKIFGFGVGFKLRTFLGSSVARYMRECFPDAILNAQEKSLEKCWLNLVGKLQVRGFKV